MRYELAGFFAPGTRSAAGRFGSLSFQCNICGQANERKMAELGREDPSCLNCGSTVRMRAMVSLLSREMFGVSLAIPDFPVRRDIRGMGMSDWEGYAGPLAGKLDYTNTYYHQEPHLDITDIDPALEGTLDFLISTDVLEHVTPPVSAAFENCARLLKPDGVLIFSVPYLLSGPTQEHFPELHEYEILKEGGSYILKNITKDGREQVFRDLVFHGGGGLTLEMRTFSLPSLLEDLDRAGFTNVKVRNEPDFEHGIYWLHEWSLPITARK
jgi:hypothetical protein